MSKVVCNTQRISVITSSLMGVIFGGAIVYILTKLVATQRRVAFLETHVARKADESTLSALSAKVDEMKATTGDVLSGLAVQVKTALSPPEPVPERTAPPPQPVPVLVPSPQDSSSAFPPADMNTRRPVPRVSLDTSNPEVHYDVISSGDVCPVPDAEPAADVCPMPDAEPADVCPMPSELPPPKPARRRRKAN